MRWESQKADAQQALIGLDGLVRSVRSPEFAGITFHEVRARSVLNKVPGQSQVPFGWTVNPYRGCSHACRYCLGGDTSILLGNGRTTRLADVRAGDEIYGTEVREGERRYVRTRVLAHWSTRKLAYRVVLADGTKLEASGDHRFLTEHGWTYVAGRRPHLTPADRLLGPGPEVPEPGTIVGPGPALDVVTVEPLGLELPMFDITTGTGDFVADGVLSHNCFARNTHTYLDFDAGHDFDSQVVVKVNAPEVLASQLRKPGWTREHVAMGTNTDPYQRAEGRYQLMPGIIRAFADNGTPFSILTKGTTLNRDLPLLRSVSTEVDVGLGVSIALLDRDLQRDLEPGTPSPQARLELVRRIRDAGLPCGVMIAPVLPGLTDSTGQLDELLAEVAATGATSATVLALHLRPGAREWFAHWLGREHPGLVPRYREIYGKGSYAGGRYRRLLAARVGPLLRRHGFARENREADHRLPEQRAAEEEPRAEQMKLL
ncbi:Rv2578c family radical SAM protein [Amycolatopsis acididurans]|uniref:Rv2578c family radical SAM protein n=1 Tax=Amycolatopsis acididurans TaxID=2724524 RepID=UPI0028AC235D|nr:Rv2578c family radical SAM protein [Amycolatopsis acididurans]